MLLFIQLKAAVNSKTGEVAGSASEMIVPMNRVCNIEVKDKNIFINYLNGDYATTADGKTYPRLAYIKLQYSTPDAANKIMRQFYKAVRDKANCFLFTIE